MVGFWLYHLLMSSLLLTDIAFAECLLGALRLILCFTVLGLLLAISLIDADTMLIPNKLNAALLACGVLAVFLVPEVTIASRLIGLCCISVPLLLFSLMIPGSFGGGDIKLMAAAGLLLGWQSVLLAAVIGLGTGGVYGACLVVSGKKRSQDHFALGPSLCLGIAVALLCGSFPT